MTPRPKGSTNPNVGATSRRPRPPPRCECDGLADGEGRCLKCGRLKPKGSAAGR